MEIFYSYSHKDEELRDQLENHLTMLKRQGVVKGWHDRRISAGQEWDGQIDEHLNAADIILLLISSDFLASDYCYDVEVIRAMERHGAGEARVIPIILRPCDWHAAPFGKLQALPKDAKPVTLWGNLDEAFLDVAKGIRKAAEEIESNQPPETLQTAESTKPAPHLHIPDFLSVSFVARKDREGKDILTRLKDELAPNKNRLTALWGAGGVGKTAIAAEVARDLVDAYNRRVVWVSAEGREDFNLSVLLDGIATQLGQSDLRKLALELKKEQVRELLTGAPTLVVLDNFETITPEEEAHCSEWLAQPGLCSALITTRQKIEVARNIPINPMLLEEARDFLQRLVAEVHDRSAFANLDRDRIIGIAEGNPLVIQWIVGQIDLAQDPDEVLDDLAHGEGSAAERVFDRSFNLPQLATGGRAVLLALSLFVPSTMRPALAEVAGMNKEKDKKRFKEALKNLSALWLIRTTEDQRLTVQGLTRELTKARLSTDPRGKTFRERFISRFMRYVNAHQQPTLADYNAIEDEKDNLLAAINIAFEMKYWHYVELIVIVIAGTQGFLGLRGYWDEAIKRNEQAIFAAQKRGDELNASVFLMRAGLFQSIRGDHIAARSAFEKALPIFKKLRSESNISAVLHNLALILQAQGEIEEARQLYNESLVIEKKLGDEDGLSRTLHQLASLEHEQGHFLEARRLYNESLEIGKKRSNQLSISAFLISLGRLAQDQGDYDEASRLYNESLGIVKRLGTPSGVAVSLHELGTLSFDKNDYETAESLLGESLAIFRRLGDKANTVECLESIGKLKVAQMRLSEAQAILHEALTMAESMSVPLKIGNVKHSLGVLAVKQGSNEKAVRLFREALGIFEKLGSWKSEMARKSLERVESELS